MRLFNCSQCGQLLFFENTSCERCGRRLGYVPEQVSLVTLEQAGANWRPLDGSEAPAFRFCDNAGTDACNWLVPAASPDRFCLACRHNRMIPDLSDTGRLLLWRKMEHAKHRLFYALLRLRLPTPTRAEDAERGLVFDVLADPETPDAHPVLTGHDNGLITLALTEADDAERERRRAQMGEPYRTLLGHFRHEVGHYYWDRLVKDRDLLDPCRAVFGDDSQDYGEALKRHYDDGPPPDWQDNYVSAYATTHPWEDFAESWAHYLHIVDSLETASAFGIEIHPVVARDESLHAELDFDPYGHEQFSRLVDAWLPVTYAMNAMNRSMGLADMYPFILTGPVIRKLAFIHTLVHGTPEEIRRAAG